MGKRVRIVGFADPEASHLATVLEAHGFEVDNCATPPGEDLLCLEPAEILTPRQVEILQALASNGNARTAADVLGLSERTINAHLDHIYRRIGVRGRQAVLCWACRRHLINTEPGSVAPAPGTGNGPESDEAESAGDQACPES